MGGEDGDSSARIPNPTDYSDGCTQTLDFDSSQNDDDDIDQLLAQLGL